MGYYLTDETVEPLRQTASIRDRACEPKTAYIGFCCMGNINQYVAFGNNPVNFRDPFGLDVWIIGGSGAFVPLMGADISAGVAFSTDPAGCMNEIGGAVALGADIGFDFAAGFSMGRFQGNKIADVQGEYRGVTVGLGPFSYSRYYDASTRRYLGWTFDIGPSWPVVGGYFTALGKTWSWKGVDVYPSPKQVKTTNNCK